MDDWENEEFEPVVPALKKEPVKSQWDDEDVEEDDVKESWEDEDEPKPPKPEPPVEKPKPKSTTKADPKSKKTDAKSPESKASSSVDSSVLADPVAEKLRQQRIEEEADYRSTRELFGNTSGEKSLENFIPKSENDFLEYAELISHKLRPYEKSFHYIGLLKTLMRLSMTTMKGADAKDVASSITAIANEKIKAEKEANAGKKKQGAKKKQLHVGRPDDDALVGDGYGALDDDFEFM